MTDDFPHDVVDGEPARPRPTRLNRRVVLAAALLLGGVIALALNLGFQRPPTLVGESEEEAERPNLLQSDVLQDAPLHDYATLTEPSPEPEPIVVSAPPEEIPLPVALPPMSAPPAFPSEQQTIVEPMPAVDPELLARERQLAQEREAALKSGLFVSGYTPKRSDDTSQRSPADRRDASASQSGFGDASESSASLDQNRQYDKRHFANVSLTGSVIVQKPYLEPYSPYEVKAGTIIPGALVTGLNSDLPGEVIGRVTEHVYDTVSGRHILIPQGTTIIGRYNSLVAYGQDRAQIVWDRLVMPDGRSIELEAMRGADRSGASGLEDEVDHHWGRIAGAVILSTAISLVSNLATDDSEEGTLSDELGSAVAQESAQVGTDFVRRNFNLQPTIRVRPGWPFTIIVHKDLILAPAS